MAELLSGQSSENPMSETGIYVSLTYDVLDIVAVMAKVKSPKAGANVMFSGTTRDTFNGKPVKQLQYTAYAPMATNTMQRICQELKAKYDLIAIAMIHRLGVVPIGEESILIAVSAKHREAGWRAGQEALELCKEKVEIWKLEEFEDEEGVWRANRDGAIGDKLNEMNTGSC